MKQYIDLITRVIDEGVEKSDRTGVGTKSIFGHQSIYDLREEFPLLTLKKTWMPGVVHELLWLLGNHTKLDEYKDLPMTNIKYLTDNRVHIWNEWADENGNLGPVYGEQWVQWKKSNSEVVNQIQSIIDRLTEGHKNFNPNDRGLIVSAWNSGVLDEMALRPCHAFFQFYTEEIKLPERIKLFNEHANDCNLEISGMSSEQAMKHYNFPTRFVSLQLYQRSADIFLGVPFNIASYSLLLHMIGSVTNMYPKKFIHTFGDAHIYSNHKNQVNQLLNRTLSEGSSLDFYRDKSSRNYVGDYVGPKLPKLKINKKENIFDYKFDDFSIINYNPLKPIKAPVAI